jgi:hypothetical protein
MKKYFCNERKMARGCYTPTDWQVMSQMPTDVIIYHAPANMRFICETNGKPANFVLAGIVWEELKPSK